MKKYFLSQFQLDALATDGGGTVELKTSADLLKQLETMKQGLEVKAKADAKAEAKALVDEQLKGINEAIENLQKAKLVTPEELKAFKDLHEADMRAIERGFAKVKGTPMPAEVKSVTFEDRLKEAVEAKHDDVQKFLRSETKSVSLELKAVGAVSTASVSGSQNFGISGEGKIISLPNNIGHVRSLLNVRPYAAATDYYFMKEVAGEGTIAPTAETTSAAAATTQATGLKPQFDIRFAEDSVKFEWIAGWMLMSRKALMNIPGLMSTLNARLPEKLLDAEDLAALYGNGTSPNWDGILNSGNYVAGSAAGATPLVEKIINDITTLEDTHKRIANGILLRPAQYNGMFLNKADGSGEYDLPPGVTFVNGQLYILGVRVAKSTALATNDYVVGDFQNGAEILVGEAMNIRLFEEDGTNVRTNQITVRVEEYAALPVYGNNFFIRGSSATS